MEHDERTASLMKQREAVRALLPKLRVLLVDDASIGEDGRLHIQYHDSLNDDRVGVHTMASRSLARRLRWIVDHLHAKPVLVAMVRPDGTIKHLHAIYATISDEVVSIETDVLLAQLEEGEDDA